MQNFKFIDLFCGIGGFHQAMQSLGGECVFASDIDKFCQDTYYKNYGIRPVGDITQVEAADIPAHDVLCGGFPCQAFSIAGKRLGFADPTKGTLFFDIMRIVRHHHPKYLLLENVRNLASHDNGNTWRVIHQELTEAGYNVSPEPVIFSPHYIGIPQHRDRVFIMGVRKDVGELPQFYFNRRLIKRCSIDTILQDDSEIKNIARYRVKPWEVELIDLWNEFLAGMRPKLKKLPMFPVTDLFMHRSVDDIPTFPYLTEPKAVTARRNVELYNVDPEFIDAWLEKAKKFPKFKGAKRMLEWHAGNPENPNIWDTVIQFRQSGIRTREPFHFPTLTAVLMVPIVGPRRRRLTPRECARLQSFPDTFQYDDNEAQAYKQFGNSVNVAVVTLFAKFLLGYEEVHEQFKTPDPSYFLQFDEYGNPRRKRGRPRKNPLPDDNAAAPRPRRPKPEGDQPKRKRGRPRKYPIQIPLPMPVVEKPKKEPVEPQPKRKRGRPRKYPLPEAPAAVMPAAEKPMEAQAEPQPKRKRGRPRKYPLPTAPAASAASPQEAQAEPQPKRKRGRPRKNPLP